MHIVSFDVPYPVDYGGVHDVFYKVKALSEEGIKVHLHCYEYGRGQQPELERYCAEVKYYPRNTGLQGLSLKLPYIVASRNHPALLQDLLQTNYPILMEGVHTTYFLHTGDLPKNRCFVRLHNVECNYYRQLAETTTTLSKKLYYQHESKLLGKYEASLKGKATFWTLTQNDLDFFTERLGYESVDFLPVYTAGTEPEWNGEKGHFCLYHGNLSVPENEHAAIWLLENVFSQLKIPFVIAGKAPSTRLQQLAHQEPHTCLVQDPGHTEMLDLIKKAHINILPSFNNTGIKLKLINALFYGRHCLLNESGMTGLMMDGTCEVANSTEEMISAVERLYSQPFSKEDFEYRSALLKAQFNNRRNARQMIQWIFEGEPTVPGQVGQKLQAQFYDLS